MGSRIWFQQTLEVNQYCDSAQIQWQPDHADEPIAPFTLARDGKERCHGYWQAGAGLLAGEAMGSIPWEQPQMRAVSRVHVLAQGLLAGPGEWDLAPCSPKPLESAALQQAAPLLQAGASGHCSSPPCPAQHCPGVWSVGSPAGLSNYFPLQQGFSTNDLGELCKPRGLAAAPGQRTDVSISLRHITAMVNVVSISQASPLPTACAYLLVTLTASLHNS